MLGGNSASVVIYQETMMGLLAVRFFSRGVCVGCGGVGGVFIKDTLVEIMGSLTSVLK